MKYSILILICILSFSCNNKKKKELSTSKKDKIIYIEAKLDTITLQVDETSFDNIKQLRGDTIIYFDKRLGYMYKLNKNGKLIKKNYKFGEGPHEINSQCVDIYLGTEKKDIFIGASLDINIHKINTEKKAHYYLGWIYNKDDSFKNYELNYGNLYMKEDKDGNIYLPIFAYTKELNPSKKDYIDKTKLFAKLDINKRKITSLVGKFPESYRQNAKYPQFHSYFLEIDKTRNDFYISFELDSLIYKYDKNFRLKETFGKKGKCMNKDYTKIESYNLKNFRKSFFNDKKRRGHYSEIKYIKELDYLCRIYHKNANKNGIQIYKDGILIGDLKIPNNINKILGYIKPYLYISNVSPNIYSNNSLDEVKENLRVIRLEL